MRIFSSDKRAQHTQKVKNINIVHIKTKYEYKSLNKILGYTPKILNIDDEILKDKLILKLVK